MFLLCLLWRYFKKYGTSAGSYTITINRAPISDPSCSYGQYYNGKKINTSNGLNIDTPDGSYILSTCTYNNEKVYSTTSAKNPGTYYIYWTVDDNHCWNNGYPDDSSKWTTGIKRDYWTIKGIDGDASYIGYYIDMNDDGIIDGIIYADVSSNATNYYLGSGHFTGSSTYYSNVVRVINYSLYTNRFKYVLLDGTGNSNFVNMNDSASVDQGWLGNSYNIGSVPSKSDLDTIKSKLSPTSGQYYKVYSSGAKWYYGDVNYITYTKGYLDDSFVESSGGGYYYGYNFKRGSEANRSTSSGSSSYLYQTLLINKI